MRITTKLKQPPAETQVTEFNRTPPALVAIVRAHIAMCNSAPGSADWKTNREKRRKLLASLSHRQRQLVFVAGSAIRRLAFGGDGKESRQ